MTPLDRPRVVIVFRRTKKFGVRAQHLWRLWARTVRRARWQARSAPFWHSSRRWHQTSNR